MPTRLTELVIQHESSNVLRIYCDPGIAARLADVEGVVYVTRRPERNLYLVELDKRYAPRDVEREIARVVSRTVKAVST